MSEPIRIAIVGLGKIAHDQHIPAIAANPDLVLAATLSPRAAALDGVPHLRDFAEMLDSGVGIDAVALCTPPQVRHALAVQALERGLHVFLEKPPGATVMEVAALSTLAATSGVTLFASWHSRFAAGVAPARAWLVERRIDRVTITWREDVRHWHPGQDWIWEAGGLGVFDPGINALSIASHILPNPFFLQSADLDLPANRAAPIAARMTFSDAAQTPIAMDLDWRQEGPQTWDIVVETDAGPCRLSRGGALLSLPGGDITSDEEEYPGLYAHFADLVRAGESDVDMVPLQLVADAFLRGERHVVDAFHDQPEEIVQ